MKIFYAITNFIEKNYNIPLLFFLIFGPVSGWRHYSIILYINIVPIYTSLYQSGKEILRIYFIFYCITLLFFLLKHACKFTRIDCTLFSMIDYFSKF